VDAVPLLRGNEPAEAGILRSGRLIEDPQQLPARSSKELVADAYGETVPVERLEVSGWMRVAQISAANGPFELVERELPEPGPHRVRVAVDACGVCHSDALTKIAAFPGMVLPRVSGHEVNGRVEAIAPGSKVGRSASAWGVGWHGGYRGKCDPCRRGKFFACVTGPPVTGISHDGGYGESMLAPVTSLARVPDGLSATDAAPLMCAGVTTFKALRNSGARSGDLVAVHGLGGLGHLGCSSRRRWASHVRFSPRPPSAPSATPREITCL
jgi:D-arabinose 1-dehydrogenase-like Zn-dependent alcohol dehydrogenase